MIKTPWNIITDWINTIDLQLFLRRDVGFDVELWEEGEEDAGLHNDDVGEQDWIIAIIVEQLRKITKLFFSRLF
jgi:hypothetical protein